MVGLNYEGKGKNKNLNDIQDEEIILDIGTKTIKKISSIIDLSNTILWNGPAGYFENDSFANGTSSIAEKISKNTIEKSLICKEKLNRSEIDWLNNYHLRVFNNLKKFMSKTEVNHLKNLCSRI